jgi:hypothetical protein
MDVEEKAQMPLEVMTHSTLIADRRPSISLSNPAGSDKGRHTGARRINYPSPIPLPAQLPRTPPSDIVVLGATKRESRRLASLTCMRHSCRASRLAHIDLQRLEWRLMVVYRGQHVFCVQHCKRRAFTRKYDAALHPALSVASLGGNFRSSVVRKG